MREPALAPPSQIRIEPTAARLERGKYRFETVTDCGGCNTRAEKGAPVVGMGFAGGFVFRFPGLRVRSANISPDGETGIGAWNEQRFLGKFRDNAHFNESKLPATARTNFTLMLRLNYRNLLDNDLRAIYAYLSTVTPMRNKVEVHPLVASGS